MRPTTASSVPRRIATAYCSPARTREAAWRVDPMLGDIVPVHTYQRGTYGPKEADSLLPNGDDWHDPAG
jgi:glucose-6-phosphate 1-dehydrogenase